MWRGLLFVLFLLAGCAPLPPTPQDIQAKRFDALPGKAVIYIVRDNLDFSRDPASVILDDTGMITTYPGTYYRWEVEPGLRRIAGYAGDSGRFAFTAEAGRLYFVQQRVSPLMHFTRSFFDLIAEPYGRAAVGRALLLGE